MIHKTFNLIFSNTFIMMTPLAINVCIGVDCIHHFIFIIIKFYFIFGFEYIYRLPVYYHCFHKKHIITTSYIIARIDNYIQVTRPGARPTNPFSSKTRFTRFSLNSWESDMILLYYYC